MAEQNLIGRNLGRYHLEVLLGAGGMGQVYRARDPGLDREVAVKVLAATLAQESGYLDRFKREARAAGKLSHPNIVPVYDVGEQDGLMYLVMQLVPGGTLREHLARRGALPLGEAISILEQVAGALQHAHERGLIHRDVKPANILMSSDGRAMLADFGIVRLTQNNETALTRMGAFVGSPEYAAPEMVLGQKADQRVDIYALGVMAYQMLAGRLPFTGLNPMSLLVQHAQEQPPAPRSFNPAISPAVEAVILKAMAKSPAARYQSALEFAQALKSAAGGQTLATQAVPPPAPVQRPTPPPPALTPAPPPSTVIPPLPGPAQQGAMSSLPTLPGEAGQPAPAGAPPVYLPAGPAFLPAQPVGSGPATQMPSGWSSGMDQSQVMPQAPTFVTGLNQAPGTPTNPPFAPPAPPARRRRTLPALIAAIALVLIVGGGGLLAYGASAGWFKAAQGPVVVGTTGHPTATSTTGPTPTSTPPPSTYYMANNFQLTNGDLQNGDMLDKSLAFGDVGTYLAHEGPNGDVYQLGDANGFGWQFGTIRIILDSNHARSFVILIDRIDTYQDAQGYFQHQVNLLHNKKVQTVGEEAASGVAFLGNQQSYQLFFRDRNIVGTIASVPMSNAPQFGDYFLAIAKVLDQNGQRCLYSVPNLNSLPTNPAGCAPGH